MLCGKASTRACILSSSCWCCALQAYVCSQAQAAARWHAWEQQGHITKHCGPPPATDAAQQQQHQSSPSARTALPHQQEGGTLFEQVFSQVPAALSSLVDRLTSQAATPSCRQAETVLADPPAACASLQQPSGAAEPAVDSQPLQPDSHAAADEEAAAAGGFDMALCLSLSLDTQQPGCEGEHAALQHAAHAPHAALQLTAMGPSAASGQPAAARPSEPQAAGREHAAALEHASLPHDRLLRQPADLILSLGATPASQAPHAAPLQPAAAEGLESQAPSAAHQADAAQQHAPLGLEAPPDPAAAQLAQPQQPAAQPGLQAPRPAAPRSEQVRPAVRTPQLSLVGKMKRTVMSQPMQQGSQDAPREQQQQPVKRTVANPLLEESCPGYATTPSGLEPEDEAWPESDAKSRDQSTAVVQDSEEAPVQPAAQPHADMQDAAAMQHAHEPLAPPDNAELEPLGSVVLETASQPVSPCTSDADRDAVDSPPKDLRPGPRLRVNGPRPVLSLAGGSGLMPTASVRQSQPSSGRPPVSLVRSVLC